MNHKVDFYFTKTQKWQLELSQLRSIVLNCGLSEVLKWGCPCYTLHTSNIVLIHEFKEYCALLFFKGALLHDTDNILIKQTENVQAARQIRFTNVAEIVNKAAIIKTYIYQAIEVEKAGLKVELKKSRALVYPEEFKKLLDQIPILKTAFKTLTPGRQRAYNLHFSAPKQSKTREARIEKCIPLIMNGKGLNDI